MAMPSCLKFQLPFQSHSSSNAAAHCLCSRASSAAWVPLTLRWWCFLLSSPTQHSLEWTCPPWSPPGFPPLHVLQ